MERNEQWVTRKAAADLRGVSECTVKRDQQKGKYPNAAQVDGTWMISVSDLIAAGHYTPDSGEEPQQTLARVRGDRELEQLRDRMVRAEERAGALEAQLRELRADKLFLQQLLLNQGRAA